MTSFSLVLFIIIVWFPLFPNNPVTLVTQQIGSFSSGKMIGTDANRRQPTKAK